MMVHLLKALHWRKFESEFVGFICFSSVLIQTLEIEQNNLYSDKACDQNIQIILI